MIYYCRYLVSPCRSRILTLASSAGKDIYLAMKQRINYKIICESLQERIVRQLRHHLGNYIIVPSYYNPKSHATIDITGPKNYGTQIHKEIVISVGQYINIECRDHEVFNEHVASPYLIDSLDKWVMILYKDIKKGRLYATEEV